MKMETPRVSVVRFDTRDIIATSGGYTPQETVVQIIYLTQDSFKKFNEFATEDRTYILAGSSKYQYLGYSGELSEFNDIVFYSSSGSKNEYDSFVKNGLRSVTNRDEYASVLDWLMKYEERN